MEVAPYGGWARCARFVAGDTEALVTLEVGPRIIRYGRIGGPNVMAEYPAQMGLTGGGEYRSYGGHRLWTAPEDLARTYEPDNAPPAVREECGGFAFTTPLGPARLEREIWLRPEEDRVVLEHRITNFGEAPVEVAPWCLTVMAAGGECLWPQPEHIPHPKALLPAAPLVLWHYTRMDDPRWSWGARIARLRHAAGAGPQKAGSFVRQGWAAYANLGSTFVKRFPADPSARYPDFGCNFETFTRHDMLEVESLGPLTALAPGGTARHPEEWRLFEGSPPREDEACAAWFEAKLPGLPPL
jgi:hypothetical protein